MERARLVVDQALAVVEQPLEVRVEAEWVDLLLPDLEATVFVRSVVLVSRMYRGSPVIRSSVPSVVAE